MSSKKKTAGPKLPPDVYEWEKADIATRKKQPAIVIAPDVKFYNKALQNPSVRPEVNTEFLKPFGSDAPSILLEPQADHLRVKSMSPADYLNITIDHNKKPDPKSIKKMNRKQKIALLEQLNASQMSRKSGSMMSFKASTNSPLKRPNTALTRKNSTSGLSSTIKKAVSPSRDYIYARRGSVQSGSVASFTTPQKKRPPSKIHATPVKPVEPQNMCSLVAAADKLKSKEVIMYLSQMLKVAKNVSDPQDDIEAIFGKIQVWKEKFGDLDQQEKAVAKKLRTKGVKIHNVKTLTAKLSELKPEIGLTDDEICLIIYTSLDHDWLTNLLVLAGQFTMWFNINFEGESREEQDFKENKEEIWMATCFYATQIINAHQKMTANQEEILTQKWWEYLRFSKFGLSMAQKFKQKPSLMTELRSIFRGQNDKIAYFDLFQFIEHILQIQLQSWEEDALEGRLDRLGMAFIEFNEMNEFSQTYGIDWGEALLETDMEDILDAKLNLSYKDYQLTDEDFFMGCPSMLMSEKAALAKVNQLYKKFKAKKRFQDNDFGPRNAEDIDGCAYAMYKTGQVPRKGYAKPTETSWIFADQLKKNIEKKTRTDDPKNIQFVDDGVASNDCVQGTLGDCWFISALSVLATRDELLIGGRKGMEYDPDMIVDKEIASILDNGVYPPIFHRFRSIGLYVLRFFKNFNWIYVIVDTRIPVNTKTQMPCFGRAQKSHEIWVCLCEKAYAKLHGCYENLISGYVDEGIQELTGMQPEKIFIRDEKSGVFPHKMVAMNYGGADGFWQFLLQRDNDSCLLGCSIKGYGKEGQLLLEGQPSGLILNHAYGINDLFEITIGGELFKLLRLRNPWGNTEWLGAWSGDSPEMKKHGAAIIKQYVSKLPPDEQFSLDADDGTFLMLYDDWRDNFSTLFLNLDFPEDWTGVRFKSEWNKSNSAGLPTKYTKEILDNYGKNPQFLIKPAYDTEIMLSLTQLGGRLPVDAKYSVYPFSEQLHYAAVGIFEVNNGDTHLSSFDKNKLTFMSPIKQERENSGRCVLKEGKSYVIVPSTEVEGKTGEFYLNIYFNQALRDVQLKRIFAPTDSSKGKEQILPYYIPEESEKLSNATPLWKIQLVQESLKFMMTDEDSGMPADDQDYENSPQPGAKKAPSDGGAGLISLVRPEDKLSSKQVIAFLNGLIQTKNKVDDPLDDIETIFNKIQKWKEAMGDLEEQETGVAEALKTPGVAIHNVKTLIEKLTVLQPQIGLSTDEIMIIIYTSLDHDHFTNMLIQAGQFTMWFNLNFEGESQEEIDFRDNKYEIWEATCFHAQQIIDAYKQLPAKDQETILTPKYWEHLRYSKFGDAMCKAFNAKPALKTELRALFASQQEKLSYWNLFQFIEHKLQVRLETWEEDALEGRLDRLGFAFIEFNEYNEFSQSYGLDWGEALLETDLEDILDAKMNLSYKDYDVTDKDYFQGCPTMLTSEKACLKVCCQILATVQKNKKKGGDMFVDVDFGPKTLGKKTDEEGGALAMYKTGEIPRKGYADPKKCDWLFIKDFCGKPPQFIDDGVGADDCLQGTLGNCWFISAMSVLAQRDELIIGGRRGMDYDPDMIVDKEIASLLDNGVYPPIFHRFRSIGLYVLRFFKNFNWIYVIVDQRVPTQIGLKSKKEEYVFGHCRDKHEMWVPLIEKAYAKLHGCYENLMSGYVDEGIQELCGMQPEKIFIRSETSGVFPHKMVRDNYGGAEGFWSFLLNRDGEGCLLGCSIKGYGKEGPQVIEGQPSGLILNHAYGINDVFELTDPWNVSKKIRLLRLRNPWGHGEWNGAWSDDSTEMKKFAPIIQKTYIEKLAPDEQFELGANDGTFMMCYEDWRDQFSTLFLNLDFPEDWTGVRFKSKWTPENSGGLPNKMQKDVLERYAKNPQFLIKPAQDTEVMISLTQTGGRLPIDGNYSVYPFSEQLNYAAVSIFKLPTGKETISMFDPEALQFMSPIKRERENSGRTKLKANVSYVICCSTELYGKLGEFYLSVYFNQGLRDVDLKRVFHEYDDQNGKEDILPYFIPEEAEKLQNATPLWKLNLVKESLSFMMTDEDTGGAEE